jgi:ankyrin repeat protein
MSLRRSFALATLLLAAPLAAQFQSEGYKFLQAIRDSKNNDVITMLNRPGSTIVNTRDANSGDAALHITARRGDAAYTTFLLQKGADPNIRDARNNTPMMAAVDAGRGNEMVPLLLLAKANPNLGNASGETPLIRAVQRRDIALVRTLLAAKADPDQRDVIAGLSARDYANRDARAAPIAKLLADTPRLTRPSVAGPKL